MENVKQVGEAMGEAMGEAKAAVDKVRENVWAERTGSVLKVAAKLVDKIPFPAGAILGGFCSMGGTLLNPDPSLADLRRAKEEIKDKMTTVLNEVDKISSELSDLANLIYDKEFYKGIRNVDAHHKVYIRDNLDKANRKFEAVAAKFETDFAKHFVVSTIFSYLKMIQNRQGRKAAEKYYQDILVSYVKYLEVQITFTNDLKHISALLDDFVTFCVKLDDLFDGMKDIPRDEEDEEAIIQSLKKVTTGEMKSSTSTEVMNAANNLKKLCARPEFRSDFISQVKADCPDIATDIPDFEKALDSLETIPLDRFSNPKEVLTFVDALINSGIAAQVERGLIFVLGNTNTGKTSLVNTFKSFVESPSMEPTSVLTEPGDDLIETQVLEVYDNLLLEQEKAFKVGLSSNSSAPTLVNLEEAQVAPLWRRLLLLAATNSSKKERLKLKIVDLGKMKSFK